MLLTLLLLTPMIGIFAISTGMSYELSFLDIKRIKTIALSTSIINLFISLIVFILFDFYLGLDGLSIYFVMLTTIITPIALLSN